LRRGVQQHQYAGLPGRARTIRAPAQRAGLWCHQALGRHHVKIGQRQRRSYLFNSYAGH
jgi:hypothetical protein